MVRLTVNAVSGNVNQVLDSTASFLKNTHFDNKTVSQVLLAVEEVFVNVCSYAYSPLTGKCTIDYENLPGRVCIKISDEGIPYNPLLKQNPDITLDAESREIGGLGILLVKKLMDDVSYACSEGKNILLLTKNK